MLTKSDEWRLKTAYKHLKSARPIALAFISQCSFSLNSPKLFSIVGIKPMPGCSLLNLWIRCTATAPWNVFDWIGPFGHFAAPILNMPFIRCLITLSFCSSCQLLNHSSNLRAIVKPKTNFLRQLINQIITQLVSMIISFPPSDSEAARVDRLVQGLHRSY